MSAVYDWSERLAAKKRETGRVRAPPGGWSSAPGCRYSPRARAVVLSLQSSPVTDSCAPLVSGLSTLSLVGGATRPSSLPRVTRQEVRPRAPPLPPPAPAPISSTRLSTTLSHPVVPLPTPPEPTDARTCTRLSRESSRTRVVHGARLSFGSTFLRWTSLMALGGGGGTRVDPTRDAARGGREKDAVG